MIRNCILCMVLTTVLCGCIAGKEYLSVQRNFEVDRSFTLGTLLEGYAYYYNGPESEPKALLALDKRFTLRSQFWHQFSDASQLQKWMHEFRRINGEYDDQVYVTIDYQGMWVLDPEGHTIGMIYTRHHWVVGWMGAGRDVYVTRPEPSGSQRGPFMKFTPRHDGR